MDDPIFDPWCLGEDARPTPPPRTSRWRGAAKAEGVPAPRPVPAPRRPPPAEIEDFMAIWYGDEPTAPTAPEPEAETPAPPDRSAPPCTDALEGPAPEASAPEAAAPVAETHRPEAGDLLRALLLPRVEALGLRLRAARHRATLDDRLDRDPPALRFRIEPWTAPFDDVETPPSTVLEVVHEGGSEGSVTASIWCDPTANEPTRQRTLPASHVTPARIDELLFDFVETALA